MSDTTARDLKDLKGAEYNPRFISDHDFKTLKNSIKELGDLSGLVFNIRTENIVGGHQRKEAYQQFGGTIEITEEFDKPNSKGTVALGYVVIEDEKYSYRVVDWPEAKEKLANLAANKATGDWDDQKLAELIYSLKENENLDWAGFNEQEVTDLLDMVMDVKKDDADVTKPKKPITKLGDIYQLGPHRLICGDSQDPKVYEKLCDGKKVKLVFTSPPYNMDADLYKGHYADDKESSEYIKFNLQVVECCKAVLDGFLCWNISYNKNTRHEFIEIIYKIINELKLQFMELIVWDKGHALPITSNQMLTRQYEDILVAGNEDAVERDMEMYVVAKNGRRGYFNKRTGRKLTNYWRIGTNNTQMDEHQAMFPVELPGKAIKLMTIDKDIVLDPFIGAGTTMIAAEQLDRVCYGIELDPGYCDVVVRRWEHFTGKTAEKL